jgi:hypothetical protein
VHYKSYGGRFLGKGKSGAQGQIQNIARAFPRPRNPTALDMTLNTFLFERGLKILVPYLLDRPYLQFCGEETMESR